jgi:hypothetical protein
MKLKKYCIRCKQGFEYGDWNKSLRGQMTRKYCDECRVTNHRVESKLYQKQKKLNNTII